ncbi:putative TPR repeat methyltransferase [Saccharothrix ecbatanensis]|uniref:Putative TPR repeat methyltransferase n=1 Tax=Saccharothrix ecbatanensis TaxID=1105145 RepID=A0A7W9LZU2_9PSEU|nr:putative TPR repeat methyltransferase [Saccharothrix ecbatanensis]
MSGIDLSAGMVERARRRHGVDRLFAGPGPRAAG